MLIELVEQLVRILLREFVVKLLLELLINQVLVLHGFSPLHFWTEMLDSREEEWLNRIELGGVLVVTQVKLEVELSLVREALVFRALINQVLEGRTVTGIVPIQIDGSLDRLARVASLKNLIK